MTFGGQTWRTDELSLREAIEIEKATGKSWMLINPFQSATDCRAIMVAFLARDMAPEVAESKVDGLSLREVLDCVDVAKDDLPDVYEDGLPKAEGEDSMTGSSGEHASSDGPPT